MSYFGSRAIFPPPKVLEQICTRASIAFARGCPSRRRRRASARVTILRSESTAKGGERGGRLRPERGRRPDGGVRRAVAHECLRVLLVRPQVLPRGLPCD